MSPPARRVRKYLRYKADDVEAWLVGRDPPLPKSQRHVACHHELSGLRRPHPPGRAIRTDRLKAQRRLVESLTTRHRVGQADEITGDTQIKMVAAQWLRGVMQKGRAINTIAAYEDTIDLHMLPGASVTRGSGS